jgi:hypothetical protein
MPDGSMAIPTDRALTAVTGAALTLVTLLACLLYVELREGPTLTLREWERSQATLMSCARGDVPLSASDDLMWCADGASPLCLPAVPASAHVELSHGVRATLFTLPSLTDPPVGVLIPWQRPTPEAHPAFRERQRLERPPRV